MKYLGKSFQFFTGVTEGPKTADLDEVFCLKPRCIKCDRLVDTDNRFTFEGDDGTAIGRARWVGPHYCPKCREDS